MNQNFPIILKPPHHDFLWNSCLNHMVIPHIPIYLCTLKWKESKNRNENEWIKLLKQSKNITRTGIHKKRTKLRRKKEIVLFIFTLLQFYFAITSDIVYSSLCLYTLIYTAMCEKMKNRHTAAVVALEQQKRKDETKFSLCIRIS